MYHKKIKPKLTANSLNIYLNEFYLCHQCLLRMGCPIMISLRDFYRRVLSMTILKCQNASNPISATELLQQAVEMQTEFGLKCQEILVKGESVPEEMIIKMIEDKVNSAEVAHHGKFCIIMKF